MTPEERQQMNSLTIGIQEEKNYARFTVLARQLNDLIERKARRFAHHPGMPVQRSGRAWKMMPGIVQRIINPLLPVQTEKVEISITEADELFREIRIDNTLTGTNGQLVALKQGAPVDVILEAEMRDSVKKPGNPDLP